MHSILIAAALALGAAAPLSQASAAVTVQQPVLI
jgi:putative iron-regulated protein